MTRIPLLLLINFVYSQLLPPECNFAATDTQFYPIGACEKTKNMSGSVPTYYAFKFVCEAGGVFKYEYDTDEYCHGTSISSTNFTGQLQDFECNLAICDYSDACSYTGCYNETADSCDECSANTQNYDSHCVPILADQCMGTSDGNLTFNECFNNELTADFFGGANCSDGSLINSFTKGGSNSSNNCLDKTYYTTDCYSRSLPTCNYAADASHFYPIDACDTKKTTNNSMVEYFAFKYICDANGDVYRNEYNDSDYCQGTPISNMKVNAELAHYECNLNDCNFADSCSLSKNSCTDTDCDYDTECIPFIVDNCIGTLGELLIYDECVNNTLTSNYYWGYDCDQASLIYNEVFVDEDECGKYYFNKIQCIDAAVTDSDSIIYHSTECSSRVSPTCNYAADDSHYYPIGACDTTKTTLNSTVQYYAFQYICDINSDVYKNEYNDSDYCQGTNISSMLINANLSSYECDLNDCNFADQCTLSLVSCDSAGCEYDITCIPTIVDNCIGIRGELLVYDECINDTLTINHFWGDCDNSSFMYNQVVYGDDTQCGSDWFNKVQCIDPTITDSIMYHSTDCTQSPTMDTIAPTVQPTDSPTIGPTIFTDSPTRSPTTRYPTKSSADSEQCDVIWKILITFRIKFIVDPTDDYYRYFIRAGCEKAFIDVVKYLLDVVWGDGFCVELSDNDLIINPEWETRRLLASETEYEIEMEVEYSEKIQDAIFERETYNENLFAEKLGDYIVGEFNSDALVNDDTSVSGLQVNDADEIHEQDGHVVEGGLINAVSIISIIDVLLFIGCMIYIYSIMRKRVGEKGHDVIPYGEFIKNLTWTERIIFLVELVVFLVHWIFIIEIMAVGKTYLGYIGLVLLLLGNVILIVRYALYKELCIEQINDIMGSVNGIGSEDSVEEVRKNDMIDEVRYRRTDISMMGLLLLSVEDIPIILFMIIIGENWVYHGTIVACFIFTLINVIMKCALLIMGKFGPVNYASAIKTANAIELAEDKVDDAGDKTPLTTKTGDEENKKTTGDGDGDKTTLKTGTDDGGDKTTTDAGGNEEEFHE